MRNLIIVVLLNAVLCALVAADNTGTSPKNEKPLVPESAAKKEPPTVEVSAPPVPIAKINLETLSVTYTKGNRVSTDEVKTFANQMVRSWFNSQRNFEACAQELEKVKKKD